MQLILHSEVQYVRQKFLTLLIIGTTSIPMLLMIVFLIIQIGFGIPAGNNPMTDSQLIVASIFSIAFSLCIIFLLRTTNLIIEIRTDGFYYKYFPFHRTFHRILPSEIKNWEIKALRPITDYGGWGIRFGFGIKGKGYIASGNSGVLFIYANNKKVLFSLQEPEKAKLALEKIFKLNK